MPITCEVLRRGRLATTHLVRRDRRERVVGVDPEELDVLPRFEHDARPPRTTPHLRPHHRPALVQLVVDVLVAPVQRHDYHHPTHSILTRRLAMAAAERSSLAPQAPVATAFDESSPQCSDASESRLAFQNVTQRHPTALLPRKAETPLSHLQRSAVAN